MSITLTVTAKGQVTLRKEVLQHLGIQPGDRLDVDLLPDGKLSLRARSGKSFSRLYGSLRKAGQPTLSVEEIGAAAAAGWAGKE